MKHPSVCMYVYFFCRMYSKTTHMEGKKSYLPPPFINTNYVNNGKAYCDHKYGNNCKIAKNLFTNQIHFYFFFMVFKIV